MTRAQRTVSNAPARRLLGLAAFLILAALPAVAQKPYTKLKYPPLRDLTLPKVERFELANGLVVYLVEDHQLPRVEGTVLVKTGARFEPAEKVGLASIVGQVMRTGGTTTRKGEEIDRLLENTGASVETAIDTDSASASLFALREHLPQALEILADLLRNPAFPDDKIELAKVQERSAIARRNDEVGGIADREFTKLVYGAASPYARHTEYATIQAVTRDDLVAFHRRYFVPNQAILGLWGDFNTAETRALVERVFGAWPRGEAAAPRPPEVPADWQGSVNFIPKDDVNQTNLRIGHVGGRFDDPDFYALNVMTEILGGGLSSRLFRHVRSDLGLAYAAGAAWIAEFDHPGYFFIRVDTKSESTVRAAQETLKEVRRLTEEPVSPEELRTAKEGILNSFVFNFDTTGEIVRRLMAYEYYGYPRDFLEKFKANVEKVTAEDVLRAAQARLKPDKLVVLAVGRQQDFDQPLSTLGAVQTIDIAIPEPTVETAAAPAATPESLARGRQVLDAAVRGMGGLEVLKGVRDLTVLSRLTQVTPGGELQLTSKLYILLPDKFRQDVITPFGELSLAYDGEQGWQKTPQGSRAAPPPLLELLRKGAARTPVRLLREAAEGMRAVQFLETAEVDGHKAEVILVTDAAGDAVKLSVDLATGNLLKLAFQGVAPGQGPVLEEQLFSDFRPVAGLMIPFKVVVLQDGKKSQERSVDSAEVNIGLDPKLFAREDEKK
jgi:predicted Zn-dependent peptidase